MSDSAEPSDARKAELLAALNSLLATQRDFYEPKAFAKVAIANEADGLLKLDRKSLPPEKLAKLNRLLLQAAYPQEFARMAIRLEAAVERGSDLSFPPDAKEPVRATVREGDFAATRFFLVRSLKATARPDAKKYDTGGYISDLTPPYLEVELQLAALRFLTIQAPKATPKRATATDSTIIPRGF